MAAFRRAPLSALAAARRVGIRGGQARCTGELAGVERERGVGAGFLGGQHQFRGAARVLDRGGELAAVAAGGTLGILIPPSVPLVIYAIITEQNIAKLFMAAFVPGIIAAIGYMLFLSRLRCSGCWYSISMVRI